MKKRVINVLLSIVMVVSLLTGISLNVNAEGQARDYELVITNVQKATADGAGNVTFDAATAETVSAAESGDVLVVTLGIKNNTDTGLFPVNFQLHMYYDSDTVTPYALFDDNMDQSDAIANAVGLKSTYMWTAQAKENTYIKMAAAGSSTKGFEIAGGTTKDIFQLAFQVNGDVTEGTARFWFDQSAPQPELCQNDGTGDDAAVDVYGGATVSVTIGTPEEGGGSEGYSFESATGTLTFTTDNAIAAWDGTAIPAEDIKAIIFSPTVSVIPDSKFQGLPNLERVDFQCNVSVGASFGGCSSLKEVTFYCPVTIKGGAFGGSNNIEVLDFRGAVTFTDGGQFSGLTKLTSVSFPSGTTLTPGIFGACSALEEITFGGDVVVLSGMFNNCQSLKTLNFDGKAEISSGAFANLTNISEINFGGAVTIGSGVLSNLQVTSLTFPAGSTIGAGSLYNLTKLEELYFMGDIDLSGGGTLSNLPALKTVYFGGTSKLANGALSSAYDLESITFVGATNMNGGSLGYLEKLKSISIPANSVLGSGVLYSCSALEEIIFLGDCVIAEGSGTLYSLDSLKTVTFMGAVDCKYDKAFTDAYIQEGDEFIYPTNPDLTVIFKSMTPNVNSGFLTYLDPNVKIVIDCEIFSAYKAHFEADTNGNATRIANISVAHSVGADGDLESTCQNGAYCSVCSTYYGDPDPEAHSWDGGTITTPATFSSVGTKTFVCAHNSDHTKTEDVPIVNIPAIENDIDELEGRVDDLEAEFGTDGEVTKLKEELDTLKEAVPNLDELTKDGGTIEQINNEIRKINDVLVLLNAEERLSLAEEALEKLAENIIPSINEKISQISEYININTNDITKLKNTVATITETLGNLENEDVRLSTLISGLENELDVLSLIVSSLADRISEAESDINALENELAEKYAELRALINDGSNDIVAINRVLQSIQYTISTLAANDDVEAEIGVLTGLIEDLEESIRFNEDNINANTDELSSLLRTVINLSDSVSVQNAAFAQIISTLSSTIAGLEGRVEQTEQDITDLGTKLEAELARLKKELSDAIAKVDSDLGLKISYVSADLHAAEVALKRADVENKAELEAKIKALETALNEAIMVVQKNLDEAKAELNEAIADGDIALDGKIIALSEALESARASLESADSANKSELITKINDAESALQVAINTLALELNTTNEKVDQLEKFIIIVCVISGVTLCGCATLAIIYVVDKKKKIN